MSSSVVMTELSVMWRRRFGCGRCSRRAIAEYKRDHAKQRRRVGSWAPLPGNAGGVSAFAEAGWDAEVARRPHGRTPPW